MSNEAKHVVRDKQINFSCRGSVPTITHSRQPYKRLQGVVVAQWPGETQALGSFYVLLQNFLMANFHMLYFDNMTADKGSVFSTPLTVVP